MPAPLSGAQAGPDVMIEESNSRIPKFEEHVAKVAKTTLSAYGTKENTTDNQNSSKFDSSRLCMWGPPFVVRV